MTFSLLADYAFDSAETIVLWLTIAIVAALIVAGIIIAIIAHKNENQELTGKYVKYALLSFIAYALIVGIIMLALKLAKRMDGDYLDSKWVSHDVIGYVLVPLLVLFAVALIGGILLFVISKTKPAYLKIASIIVGVLIAAGLVTAFATICIYYYDHIAEDGYYSKYLEQINLYVSAVVLIIIAVAGALILGRKDNKPFDSRCVALAGVCLALSFVLSYIKLWTMPQGGSITLVSLLPVMLFAYIYGPKKGVLVGFIYGIMQAMQDPFIIHPAQFILDYPVAFAMVGFAGVFKNIQSIKIPQIKFTLGAVLASVLRFVSHLLSGVFAFGAWGIDAGYTNLWLYSLAYNSFVFVDIALVIVAGIILFSSKSFVKQLDSYAQNVKSKNENT